MSDTQIIQRTEPLPDGLAVFLAGEIDLATSPAVRTGLMGFVDAGASRLVVDLSAVPYMDSSGVATLVEVLQKQRQRSGRMILCGLQPKVRSIFEISRLDMIFTIVEDLPAARSA